jgi:hypothetical protein
VIHADPLVLISPFCSKAAVSEDVRSRNEELAASLKAFNTAFEEERRSRLEREKAILDKLSAEEHGSLARYEEERSAREQVREAQERCLSRELHRGSAKCLAARWLESPCRCIWLQKPDSKMQCRCGQSEMKNSRFAKHSRVVLCVCVCVCVCVCLRAHHTTFHSSYRAQCWRRSLRSRTLLPQRRESVRRKMTT